MKYKKAFPDIDTSFAKYVVGKAIGLTKPTAGIILNIIVGAIVVAAIFLAGYTLTVGVQKLGWYEGCYLGILNPAKIHDDDYLGDIGHAPWFIAVGTLFVPWLMYSIGSGITQRIKRKYNNV